MLTLNSAEKTNKNPQSFAAIFCLHSHFIPCLNRCHFVLYIFCFVLKFISLFLFCCFLLSFKDNLSCTYISSISIVIHWALCVVVLEFGSKYLVAVWSVLDQPPIMNFLFFFIKSIVDVSITINKNVLNWLLNISI